MPSKISNLYHSIKKKVAGTAKRSANFLHAIFFKNVFYQQSLQSLLLTYILVLIYYFSGMSEDLGLRLSLSRKFSNLLKYITRIYIPKALRNLIFKTYSRIYDVNLSEIQEDIMKFKNFNEFFTRKIKPRNIDSSNPDEIVSPADSKILSLSEIEGDECLLIKGRYYRLGELLTGIKDHKLTNENIQALKRNPSNKLFQCVFYLNPGDYHRFHSPADFLVTFRNHIVGYLLPVKESYLLKNEKVYEINERVALFGEWKHGFMSMILVGAMNVGTIALNFDKELTTNTKLKRNFQKNHLKDYSSKSSNQEKESLLIQKDFLFQKFETNLTPKKKNSWSGNYNHKNSATFHQNQRGYIVEKGNEMGRFNMGSTVVVIFETRPDFQLSAAPGDRVVYGQQVGTHHHN